MNKVLKYFLCCFTVLFSITVQSQNCWEYEEYNPPNRVGGSVVISEMYFDTHYSERIETKYHHIGEFVEFFNSSTTDIDMSGWKIKDHHTEYIFPSGTTIASGDILILTYAGRVVDNQPGPGVLFGEEKFVDLFPEAAGHEDKIILQNNFVLYNNYATVQLFNEHGFLIDQVKYTTQGPAGSPECADYNFCDDLDNGDGGVFNGPIYASLAEQLAAQGFEPSPTIRFFKKAVHIENSIDYYDHSDLLDSYVANDATPFSIPFTITLQAPSEALDAFPPPLAPSITNFSATQNYIYAESFDVNGEMVAKSGSYFNGLGKATISYSWDKEQNKVWGTEVRYDNQGRAALQTISAPSCNGFVTNPRFLWGGYGNYVSNDSDYNSLGTINLPTNTLSSLKRYYSDDNSNEPLQATTNRPYSRTVYDKLNPGNLIKTIGGNQIDGEWKTGYSFTVPAAQEMYYIFGKNYFDGTVTGSGEEVITKYFKTVSIDPHGNENVLFTDAEGKTLAAARSGGFQHYEVISVIGEQGFVDVHIPQGVNTVNFLTSTSEYTIYDLKTGNTVSTSSMSGGNVYRVEATPTEDSKTFITSSGNVSVSSGAKGVRYNVNYYDYALNYYDDTGRLKESTQPLGFNDSCLLSVQNSVTHGMLTTYQYDGIGQIMETTSPDEGIAKFKYRKDGQIRFSQNSKQILVNEVSFTDYDAQARPLKSGVGNANFNSLNSDMSNITIGLKEIEETLYDVADTDLPSVITSNGLTPSEYVQTFLSGNVSMTKITPNAGATATSSTWYCYDAYGRVKWTAQNINGLGLKTIHYKYDYKDNVKKVIYQKDKSAELFVHKYTYDINNRLAKVETSSNDVNFKEQSNYNYYKSGELKRMEVANGVQGTDYVYTLSGRLKSINDPNLTSNQDLGGDVNDLFGMTIDYYNGDYTRTGSPVQTSSSGMNRYDGNIKATRWGIKGLSQTDGSGNIIPDGYTYNYNSNKWLTGATFGSTNASATITASPDYKVSNITYDANGNIETLDRTKNTVGLSNRMDEFDYNYDSNKLNHIVDNAPSPSDANDLETQSPGNYVYNEIGQLTTNNEERITYEYNAAGLVTKVKKLTGGSIVEFEYDDKGQRLSKQSFNLITGVPTDKTYYIRDTNGMPMAIYNNSDLKEHPIYGSSRVGIHYRGDGSDAYQLTDHLGNVRAVMQQQASDDPIIYEENFNDITTIVPGTFTTSSFADASIEEQQLKVTVNRNWNYAYLLPNLEVGKTYQVSFKLRMESVQGQFYALAKKASGGSYLYHSGSSIQENGYYMYSITPTASGIHRLYFGGCRIVDHPNDEDFIQPNVFYLDDVEIKDTTTDVLAHTDYYPFGMPMPNRIDGANSYRYAFQGQEKDEETGKEAFELRLWDGRIGRWLTTDPAGQFSSPYLGMGNNPINGVDPDGAKWFTDYIIQETGERVEIKDGIEQVVSIAQKDLDEILKAWDDSNFGIYYSRLQEYTPLNLSVGDFNAIAGTLYAEAGIKATWEESAGIYSAMENRASADGVSVLDVASGGGVYGYSDRHLIFDKLAQKNRVNNTYKGLIEGYYGSDFTNGAYYWHGNDFYRKVTWSKAHERFYLTGFKFTNTAHDIWKIGNHKTKHSWIYKYESTDAIGETTFMRLTNAWMEAAGRNTKWNGNQR